MKLSFRKGLTFGLTSGAITTLGLIVGLHSGTHSRPVVLGGILTIAVADAFSDALGVHISEESENKHTSKEIWESTISTFASKFLFALTFMLPVIFFELSTALVVSIVYGLFVLCLLSYFIALDEKSRIISVIMEHLIIAVIVITISHFVGEWIAGQFV